MHLTSLAAFKVALCIAHGLPVPFIVKIILDDLADQALNAPRRLPWFSTGNALGFNCPREYQHYGWPYYGAAQSGIRPSLSREEFRSHFLFPSIVFAEVLAALRFPRSPGRPPNKDFAYMHDANGVPIRWVSQETAFLVFLKRMRTRGSVVIQLQAFFGRSIGWISQVYNAVLEFICSRWVPQKIQNLDGRVFDYWRLKDYEKCLRRNGLNLPGCVGFVDGTFHKINRPGKDGNNGELQGLFYNGSKKDHGPIFEMITTPDGIIVRANGGHAGRHHDVYVARESDLLGEFETRALKNFRLFGDKAYQGFGDKILHPYLAPQAGSYEAWFNKYTSGYRIEVEHNIGNLYMQCAVLQNEMNIETQLPECWFQASVFIHNVHTCVMHSNQTAIRFGMPPLSLARYLS